jgi:hypothetical protein
MASKHSQKPKSLISITRPDLRASPVGPKFVSANGWAEQPQTTTNKSREGI